MALFYPPTEKVASAGKSHLLAEDEANYMAARGTIEYNVDRQGYVLADGKTWDDYVADMNVIEPPEDSCYDPNEVRDINGHTIG